MKSSLFSLLSAVLPTPALLISSQNIHSLLLCMTNTSSNGATTLPRKLSNSPCESARRVGWDSVSRPVDKCHAGSDVIIGWVNDRGEVVFHDRFAEGRALQAIDESQDWILEFGKEESGYTILGFRRSITTCDPKDLDILAGTSRVVWSWHSSDPVNADSVMRHEYMGSTSINLLGGLSNPPPPPPDSDSFVIAMNNSHIGGCSLKGGYGWLQVVVYISFHQSTQTGLQLSLTWKHIEQSHT